MRRGRLGDAVMMPVSVPGLHHSRALALASGHETGEHAPTATADGVCLAAALLLALVSEATAIAAEDPEGDEEETGNGDTDNGAGCEASSASSLVHVVLVCDSHWSDQVTL